MHLSCLTARLRVRLKSEDGFTMATAMLGILVVTLAMVGTVTAVNGDINLTSRDMEHKRAYEAAQAGIADYAFHLNNDNGYWAKCTDVPAPNAVNQQGTTTNRRPVPGGGGASYAIELLPATGNSVCDPSDPVASMIEQSGAATGTFRIRSTGYFDDVEQRIVASFKRASFLDFVYFTQFETSDPVIYPSSSWRNWAAINCARTRYEGRPMQTSNQPYCTEISFTNGEGINGPFHTNDSISTTGHPVFGRGPSDLVEVSAPDPGCFQTGSSSECTKTVLGTWLTGAPVLTPPPTNSQLKHVEGVMGFTGQVYITLAGSTMTVKSGPYSGSPTLYSGAIPTSGVVYVSQASCSTSYSPFDVNYPTSSGCGNAYVRGTYTERLTIAAENDVIVRDDVLASGSEGMLGLIANNFVRVYHPCGSGDLGSVRIDAAILAIQHSFIVDEYDCGSPQGTLEVNGVIAQKFRGPVGTFNSSTGTTVSGYTKDYNYDDRLRYIAPPHFLDPVEAAWHMQRQTLAP